MAVLDVVVDPVTEQRLTALERANEVRMFRAELKRKVKRRHVSAVELLSDPEPRLATMKVLDLLLAEPKVGRVKANKLLARARLGPAKTIGGMTERQRRELVTIFRRTVITS